MFTLIVVQLVTFHSVDGYEVTINPEQVTSLYAAKPNKSNKLFVEGANCGIGLTDGKLITVAEDCDAVRKAIGIEK